MSSNYWKLETYKNQDLTEWFKSAEQKGYYNNSSPEMLFNLLETEDDAELFLLYYKDRVVGNVIAHRIKSLNILGKDAFRIAARLCVVGNLIDGERSPKNLRLKTVSGDPNHYHVNHVGAQFLYTACINYVGLDKPMYISTNDSPVASQRAMHRKFIPYWQKVGIVQPPIELEYRLQFQSFWKFNAEYFLDRVREQRWPEAQEVVPI